MTHHKDTWPKARGPNKCVAVSPYMAIYVRGIVNLSQLLIILIAYNTDIEKDNENIHTIICLLIPV